MSGKINIWKFINVRGLDKSYNECKDFMGNVIEGKMFVNREWNIEERVMQQLVEDETY